MVFTSNFVFQPGRLKQQWLVSVELVLTHEILLIKFNKSLTNNLQINILFLGKKRERNSNVDLG